ncbi:hypothetical protein BH23BAC4_BH23BAC4_02010 [soil metagenome]
MGGFIGYLDEWLLSGRPLKHTGDTLDLRLLRP